MEQPLTESQFYAEVFKGEDGDYHWHVKHKNGNVVGDGGEGYKDKTECAIMAAKILDNSIPIKVVTRRKK